jgi:hypothetical protein
LGAVVLSGCTTNFCTNLDKANIAYSFEQGVTIYCDKDQVPAAYADKAWKVFDSNDNLYAYIPVDENGDYSAQKAIMLTTTIQIGPHEQYQHSLAGIFQSHGPAGPGRSHPRVQSDGRHRQCFHHHRGSD